MSREKELKVLGVKAEMCMMGHTIPITSNDDAEYILGYILKTLGAEHTDGRRLLIEATKYCKKYDVKYINCSTVQGDRMVAILMETDEDEEPFDILSDMGAFGYVYNIDAPFCSELGYSFYEKVDGGKRIRRIG